MRSKSFAGMTCSIAGALESVGDRWSLLVLRDLIPGGHTVPNGGSVILRYDLETTRKLLGYEPKEKWPQGIEIVLKVQSQRQ